MKQLFGSFDNRSLRVLADNKRYHLPGKLLVKAERAWSELLQQTIARGGKVWNGRVYRLVGFMKNPNGFIIHLGEIDFKCHYVTPFLKRELALLPFEQWPNGIFVASYIISIDKMVILSKKSEASTLRNNVNLIGGNLSADDRSIRAASDIFDSFSREFNEETGLSQKHIVSTKSIGIWLTDSLRIGIFLVVKIDMSAENFMENAKPNFEHKEFVVVKPEDLSHLNEKSYGKINPYIFATTPALLKAM